MWLSQSAPVDLKLRAGGSIWARFARNNFYLFGKRFFIVVLALILSFSTMGFIICIGLILKFMLIKKNRFRFFMFLLFFAIFNLLFFSFEIPQVERILDSFRGGGSYQERISKGPALFSNLDFDDAILGTGPGQLFVAIANYRLANYNELASNEYMNGFFAEFIAFGILGGVLLNLFCLSLFTRSDDIFFKYCFFIFLKFGDSLNLTSANTIFLLIVLLCNSKRNKHIKSFPEKLFKQKVYSSKVSPKTGFR